MKEECQVRAVCYPNLRNGCEPEFAAGLYCPDLETRNTFCPFFSDVKKKKKKEKKELLDTPDPWQWLALRSGGSRS